MSFLYKPTRLLAPGPIASRSPTQCSPECNLPKPIFSSPNVESCTSSFFLHQIAFISRFPGIHFPTRLRLLYARDLVILRDLGCAQISLHGRDEAESSCFSPPTKPSDIEGKIISSGTANQPSESVFCVRAKSMPEAKLALIIDNKCTAATVWLLEPCHPCRLRRRE